MHGERQSELRARVPDRVVERVAVGALRAARDQHLDDVRVAAEPPDLARGARGVLRRDDERALQPGIQRQPRGDEPVVVGARERLREVRVGERGDLDRLLPVEHGDVDAVRVQQLLAQERVIRARRPAARRDGVRALEVLGMQPRPVRVRERAAPARQLPALQVAAEGRVEVGEEDVGRGPVVVDVAVDHAGESCHVAGRVAAAT
jgi:hypothetical protein